MCDKKWEQKTDGSDNCTVELNYVFWTDICYLKKYNKVKTFLFAFLMTSLMCSAHMNDRDGETHDLSSVVSTALAASKFASLCFEKGCIIDIIPFVQLTPVE